MGKVMSRLTRPIRMINIDNRAEIVISRSKPVPAPTHASTQQQLEVAKKTSPSFMEDHYKKDANLDDNLKQVFITSQDLEIVEKSISNPDKLLPQKRHSTAEFEYGFWEPKTVPDGKITLRQALELLAANALQPRLNNKTVLAKKYNLDPKIVENFINYYRIYEKAPIDPNNKKKEEEQFGNPLRKLVAQHESVKEKKIKN